jgi:hypothetical protein
VVGRQDSGGERGDAPPGCVIGELDQQQRCDAVPRPVAGHREGDLGAAEAVAPVLGVPDDPLRPAGERHQAAPSVGRDRQCGAGLPGDVDATGEEAHVPRVIRQAAQEGFERAQVPRADLSHGHGGAVAEGDVDPPRCREVSHDGPGGRSG